MVAQVLAWSLLGMALLVLGLLASSLRVGVRVDGGRAAAWVGLGALHVGASWPERTLTLRLFGVRVLRRPLGSGGETRRRDDEPSSHRGERTRGEDRGRRRRRSLRDVTTTLAAYRRVVTRALRRVRVDLLDGHLRVATPDPALTGIVYGLLEAARSALPTARRERLTLEADFATDLPGGRATVALRVRVAVLALAGWQLFWFERGRSRRARRARGTPGRSDHATHRTARGTRGAGA